VADYFGLEDEALLEVDPRIVEDQRKRELFDEQFKSFFNPDVTQNAWYDKEYVQRYANDPKIQKFLDQKGELLRRRGEYIARQAQEGNLDPFVKHSEWLKKQDILPSDARPAGDFLNKFITQYGLGDKFSGLTFHDIYAHAIPEKYLGAVDKSLPKNISAADEARAVLIETLGGIVSGDAEKYNPAAIDAALAGARQDAQFNNEPRFYERYFSDDKLNEYRALEELYLDKAKKEGWKNSYGTELYSTDPRVSDPDTNFTKKYEGTPWEDNTPSTIKEDIKKAVNKRFPSYKPSDIADFFEKAGAPYVRDLVVSDKLTLAPEVYANLNNPNFTEKNAAAFLNNALFSLDPVSVIPLGLKEFGGALRRTPSALLPGVADLIPSPEAIRTGYAQGPVAMGKQMGQEFIQSLPAAAGFAGVLATPIAAPLAPGIGAGLVGTAGTRALNEVVRQETGEGIVPKLRQFIGTAPRTGIAAQPRVGEQPLIAEIKPLTTAQKAETTRQANRK
jgi:hypothetical protein